MIEWLSVGWLLRVSILACLRTKGFNGQIHSLGTQMETLERNRKKGNQLARLLCINLHVRNQWIDCNKRTNEQKKIEENTNSNKSIDIEQ